MAQHLQGKGEGTTIGVIVDHDSGSLSFRVNGSHLLPACSSLEKNASLLPWVSLVFRQDSVGFVSRYVRTGEDDIELSRERIVTLASSQTGTW